MNQWTLDVLDKMFLPQGHPLYDRRDVLRRLEERLQEDMTPEDPRPAWDPHHDVDEHGQQREPLGRGVPHNPNPRNHTIEIEAPEEVHLVTNYDNYVHPAEHQFQLDVEFTEQPAQLTVPPKARIFDEVELPIVDNIMTYLCIGPNER